MNYPEGGGNQVFIGCNSIPLLIFSLIDASGGGGFFHDELVELRE